MPSPKTMFAGRQPMRVEISVLRSRWLGSAYFQISASAACMAVSALGEGP